MQELKLTVYQRTAKTGTKYYWGKRDVDGSTVDVTVFKGKDAEGKDGTPQPTLSIIVKIGGQAPTYSGPGQDNPMDDPIPF